MLGWTLFIKNTVKNIKYTKINILEYFYTYLRACKKASGWYGSLFSLASDTRNAMKSSCNFSVAIWIRGLLASTVGPAKASKSLLLQLRLLLDVKDIPVLPNEEDLAYIQRMKIATIYSIRYALHIKKNIFFCIFTFVWICFSFKLDRSVARWCKLCRKEGANLKVYNTQLRKQVFPRLHKVAIFKPSELEPDTS